MSGIQKLTSLFPPSLAAANNLSDLVSVTAALTALGLGTTAAAELARIGAAPAATAALASDLSRVLQNLLYTSLLVAALRGVPDGLVDGVVDPFSTTADVNTSTSSGYTFSSSSGTIGAAVSSAANVQAAGQSLASSNTSSAGNAFDSNSNTSWTSAETGSAANGVAFIGQDFGSGNAKTISQVTFTGSSGPSYCITSALFQTADAPGGPWTTVQALTLTATASVQTFSISGATARRCARLLANSAAGNSGWYVQDITMQAAGTVSAMTLQSATLASAVASPSAGRVLVQVDPGSAAFTPNTDLLAYFSRDGGTTFTQGTLSAVGTMPDGTTIYDTGYFSVSGQPAGNSTMTYKLTTPTQKAIVLTGVSMQVKP